MKKFIITLMTVIALGSISTRASAASKEITVTGNLVCAKCTLHETKECQNVVQVMQDGKTVNYYLKENDVSKAAHEPICGGASEKVTVTGTVTEKSGKETLTPTKIDVVKS